MPRLCHLTCKGELREQIKPPGLYNILRVTIRDKVGIMASQKGVFLVQATLKYCRIEVTFLGRNSWALLILFFCPGNSNTYSTGKSNLTKVR